MRTVLTQFLYTYTSSSPLLRVVKTAHKTEIESSNVEVSQLVERADTARAGKRFKSAAYLYEEAYILSQEEEEEDKVGGDALLIFEYIFSTGLYHD